MARIRKIGLDGDFNVMTPSNPQHAVVTDINEQRSVMLKKIGNTAIRTHHRASCHCGAVILEIHLPDGVPSPHRCDCSFCKRKGAIVAAVAWADLKVIRGKSALSRYQFGKQVAEHYFCKNCGTYTHHRRSNNPEQFGFNIGCLEGVNPFDLNDVPVADGGVWNSL